MADAADKANDLQEQHLANAIDAARGELKSGKPGDCELCGEYSTRLINGACAPCRDKYGLE